MQLSSPARSGMRFPSQRHQRKADPLAAAGRPNVQIIDDAGKAAKLHAVPQREDDIAGRLPTSPGEPGGSSRFVRQEAVEARFGPFSIERVIRFGMELAHEIDQLSAGANAQSMEDRRHVMAPRSQRERDKQALRIRDHANADGE
jgi:hypothetical protein